LTSAVARQKKAVQRCVLPEAITNIATGAASLIIKNKDALQFSRVEGPGQCRQTQGRQNFEETEVEEDFHARPPSQGAQQAARVLCRVA
jgi:hypothetical protein